MESWGFDEAASAASTVTYLVPDELEQALVVRITLGVP